ncbi:OVARIAN TUMOR DOMAIN-containing deubiquitinating enzyme 4 isoform X2 [Benincasa hispida]|uniref:OVARIAN TUMOR DOMAIN-containing deubiquitinating enzyme 4 isoform X2 n=1 Tax=Benincasa hispida TaxID=102211 RepID=UPI00190107AC|nr:OVARIAN TUMOR DOMAIN-containing deubiquitinating enzyme 4 isoform X2 [Benincasa hispida]
MSIGSISVSTRNAVPLNFRVCTQMGSNICTVLSRGTSTSCCSYGISRPKYADQSVTTISSCSPKSSQRFQGRCLISCFSRRSIDFRALTVKDLISDGGSCGRELEISLALKAYEEDDAEENSGSSHVKFSHGKKVYTNYSVIGIPGDGRCLFRSVAHGACLRSGKPAPSESLQRVLADELRSKVADEFIKRREETEWFVEGNFDTYVSNMRKPHVWGGEPELFMASHVLHAPIIVYMYDKDSGGLISIAEYGDEYGKENPIRVLYHGFGHYDALQIPAKQGVGRSKL